MKLNSSTVARLAFVLYIFFIFFGTALPFQEKLASADDISSSNVFSQFIYSTIYLLAGVALFTKRRALAAFIRREKCLTLFLLWCLLTVLWSDFPMTSFKRWMQAFGSFVVLTAALLHFDSPENALDNIKKILLVYLPLSLLAVLFVYEATQWEFPAWRGLAPSKNWLGQITLTSVIVWSSFWSQKNTRRKWLGAVFFAISLILLLGSKSTTSMLALGVVAVSAAFLAFERRMAQLGVGYFLSLFLLGAVSFLLLLAAWENIDVKATFFDALGKDATFTDRIFLWTAVIENAQQHVLTGGGFDGFWVVGNEEMDYMYKKFVWLPNQAHNGYIDMLNEIGVIGVGLFLLVICNFFIALAKLQSPQIWKWFIVAALIVNLQESTFFRFNAVSGIMFTLGYLAVFRQRQLQNRQRENRHMSSEQPNTEPAPTLR